MQLIMSWSAGKDSLLALNNAIKSGHQVRGLLTVVSEDDKSCHHSIPWPLLQQQADAIGYPIHKIAVRTDEEPISFDDRIAQFLFEQKECGIEGVAFGDINLVDLRKYREDNLKKVNLQAIFPLWQQNTYSLATAFIKSGHSAVVTCVDTRVLDSSFVGQQFGSAFLSAIPSTVDPCGENGEFHTFVYAGPLFQRSISYTISGRSIRDEHFSYSNFSTLLNKEDGRAGES